jgi:hypothetical protein
LIEGVFLVNVHAPMLKEVSLLNYFIFYEKNILARCGGAYAFCLSGLV